jgi:hypothetical protein
MYLQVKVASLKNELAFDEYQIKSRWADIKQDHLPLRYDNRVAALQIILVRSAAGCHTSRAGDPA